MEAGKKTGGRMRRMKTEKRGWVLLAAAMLGSLFLTGCQGGGNREVEEYLEDRYGDMEFQVEEAQEDGQNCWRVTPAEFPEICFTVREGKLEESMDWSFQDDYAAQMLYGGAQRLGLSYEKGTEGYDIFVTYEDYASLDSVAELLARLAADCMESRAFDKLRNTCLITVKPQAEENTYCPGYQIRINTRYTYPVDKQFGVMASDLDVTQLKENLRLFHIYYTYQYTIQQDCGQFSLKDLRRYQDICTGATATADDGSVTVYDLVNRGEIGLDFGGAYHILHSEGLVTAASKDCFTASGNGLTVEFARNFTQQGPYVSYQILEGETDPLYEDMDNDTRYIVRSLTGKSISFSTPVKTAAAKEAERLERLPAVTEAFEQTALPGEAVTVGPAVVTVQRAEMDRQLEGMYGTMDSGEENVWVRVNLSITNTAASELHLFSIWSPAGTEDQFFIIAADRDANLYLPVDVINLGIDALYSTALPGGETAEGLIYFSLPKELAEKGDLILLAFCGTESASLLFAEAFAEE